MFVMEDGELQCLKLEYSRSNNIFSFVE